MYISAYTDASVTSFGTCSSTNNWEAKAVDFYHYPDIHMPRFKGKNFLRIYKWWIPSFWSKEKDNSDFIRTRQNTVFTTDHYSNRGLLILVHSVWCIYYIRLYYTVSRNSHFLLTRTSFSRGGDGMIFLSSSVTLSDKMY